MLYQEELETLEKIAKLKENGYLHENTILALLKIEMDIADKFNKERETFDLSTIAIHKLYEKNIIDTRICNCLLRSGIKTMKEVEEREYDIKSYRIRNLGKKGIDKILELLSEYKEKGYK